MYQKKKDFPSNPAARKLPLSYAVFFIYLHIYLRLKTQQNIFNLKPFTR